MDELEAKTGERGRQFVTALARGLDVLRAFRPGEVSLGNQELAERTGLPKPTVTRLTHTLCELGYLLHQRRDGTYQLGPAVLGLGFTMLSGLEVRDRARPLIRTLAEEIDCAVALGLRDRLNLVYVEVARGCGSITLTLDVGSRIPLVSTAMGRAILVTLPAAERALAVAEACERDPENAGGLREGVERALQDHARWGFVTSFGDWRKEVHAVGAALHLSGTEQSYAINCGGPAFLKDPQQLIEVVGPKLLALTRALSTGPQMVEDLAS